MRRENGALTDDYFMHATFLNVTARHGKVNAGLEQATAHSRRAERNRADIAFSRFGVALHSFNSCSIVA